MATTKHTTDVLRGYIQDLLAVHRHTAEAMKRHADDDALDTVPGAADLVRETVSMLENHLHDLQTLLGVTGGQGPVGQVKEAVTAVTGFITGIYGQARTDTAPRMLRDDATSIHFIQVCTGMLHTTALAFKDDATARVTSEMIKHHAPIAVRFGEIVPHAVQADLAKDYAVVDANAADRAVRVLQEAWQSASAHG
ncbi:MAG TPA: hypothetical protein VD971_08510 [Phycisphaerales bacterium]|nr:hypothetical protein [Phycisphaerales bacterium]